jgi:hypothetical protein
MFMGDVCFTMNYKDLNNLNNNEISNTITAWSRPNENIYSKVLSFSINNTEHTKSKPSKCWDFG